MFTKLKQNHRLLILGVLGAILLVWAGVTIVATGNLFYPFFISI